jgi:hypothetical protein
MDHFASILFAWNDWVIFPILIVAAFILHIRQRKISTLTIALGLGAVLCGHALTMSYSKTPLHIVYVVGLVIGTLGLVVSVTSAVWFLRKDYVSPAK